MYEHYQGFDVERNSIIQFGATKNEKCFAKIVHDLHKPDSLLPGVIITTLSQFNFQRLSLYVQNNYSTNKALLSKVIYMYTVYLYRCGQLVPQRDLNIRTERVSVIFT